MKREDLLEAIYQLAAIGMPVGTARILAKNVLDVLDANGGYTVPGAVAPAVEIEKPAKAKKAKASEES